MQPAAGPPQSISPIMDYRRPLAYEAYTQTPATCAACACKGTRCLPTVDVALAVPRKALQNPSRSPCAGDAQIGLVACRPRAQASSMYRGRTAMSP